MKSISFLSIITQNLTLPSTIYHLSSRGGFIFSSVVFASCIVSLHTHLPIYCCTINTIEYHLIPIVYDYVK